MAAAVLGEGATAIAIARKVVKEANASMNSKVAGERKYSGVVVVAAEWAD
jgi:hypothetical protein